MDTSTNLWRIAAESSLDAESTAGVIPFMEKQCDDLKDACGGRVLGRFEEINLSIAPAIKGAAIIADTMSKVQPVEEEALDRKNASRLYHETVYAFEIYNETYKFRVFKIKLGPLYPAVLTIDEGIYEEVNKRYPAFKKDGSTRYSLSVSSDEDFDRYFSAILESRKLRYILQTLVKGQ